MPPFGKRWFRVLKGLRVGHPIAEFRIHWMMLNFQEDAKAEGKQRKDEIDYLSFFINPEIYAKIKGLDTETGFKIVQDTTAYDLKMDAAAKGEPMIDERREDIAEMVRRKRSEAERARGERTAARGERPSMRPAAIDLDSDDLIIEE